ncbi:MAG: tRNA dimethylallyltransferase [Candidatus Moranbacteria bacterium GW2011_GWF2_34_56]|nr:MAG: tRNA dimethylallyltransferase [Candidatus Moranbacteria bacterium GW2011_GWF1_34_10]KKP65408.1 MAG: tRNA dimethylallyltransferase [Candidatus Moranbacteria bacterium GW2011_GWF2_34_56]HBI16616.1 tRNA (adenosine(37)-N6)-dimethylallyltransferase MiaA [Candidatus Moranbacteria bacterium]
MNNSQKIIVILGPTASGKSSTAIKLAQKFDGEIISVDSRQIYRGMDIGSGKITKEEQEIIPHWMLNIVSPKTNFSAAQFKKKTDKIIADILRRGKLPILCGGTGFWIKAIVDDVIYPKVKPNWKLREELNKKDLGELLKELKNLDTERVKTIDINNKVRLIRAIEICQTLGQVPVVQNKPENKKYEFLQIGIKREKEILHKRIKLNVKKRFESGMIEEVEKLKESGLSWEKLESFGLSYKLIPQYLKGEIKTEEELLEKIYLAEKNYAKRQVTWFKKDPRIKWLENYKETEKEIINFLSNK